MPEYRECWIHFKHVQHVFMEHPDHDWTVLRLWANLTEKEGAEGVARPLEALRADCTLTRGGNKRRPQTGTRPNTGGPSEGMEPVLGEHAHLPLWPSQFRSEDHLEEFAMKALSGLCLRGFRPSPRAEVADIGLLLMQVGPLLWVFLAVFWWTSDFFSFGSTHTHQPNSTHQLSGMRALSVPTPRFVPYNC